MLEPTNDHQLPPRAGKHYIYQLSLGQMAEPGLDGAGARPLGPRGISDQRDDHHGRLSTLERVNRRELIPGQQASPAEQFPLGPVGSQHSEWVLAVSILIPARKRPQTLEQFKHYGRLARIPP